MTRVTVKPIPAWMVLLSILVVLLVFVYLISTNREVQFWPNPRIARASSCAPSACVRTDGACGVVRLWAGSTNDRVSHGADVRVTNPAPGQNHYTREGDGRTANGQVVGVSWECE